MFSDENNIDTTLKQDTAITNDTSQVNYLQDNQEDTKTVDYQEKNTNFNC